MKKVILTMFILFGFFSVSTQAQDIIEFKDNKKVEAKVLLVTSEYIEYRYHDMPNGPIFEVNVMELNKIRFSNGTIHNFDNSPVSDEIFYAGNKRNIIKLNFLQLITNTTELHYERSLRPGLSLEGSVGIIGIGINSGDFDHSGFFVKFAPRIIKQPNSQRHFNRNTHILRGFFIKPELMIGHYKEKIDDYYQVREFSSPFFTLSILLGNQFVFSNTFSLELYGGAGIGSYKEGSSVNDRPYYGEITPGYGVLTQGGFYLTGGVKVGYLF